MISCYERYKLFYKGDRNKTHLESSSLYHSSQIEAYFLRKEEKEITWLAYADIDWFWMKMRFNRHDEESIWRK